MEERSLKVLAADTTFFNRISNTLTKLLMPTKIGLNGFLITIKRTNALKAFEALENADMIGMSSVFVTEPDFVQKLENGKEDDIGLGFELDELSDLAIPRRAFKDLIEFMDFGGSLPQETRDELRKLTEQDETSYFKEFK